MRCEEPIPLTCGSGCCGGCGRRELPVGGNLQGQRCRRSEGVAAVPGDGSAAAHKVGGRRALCTAGQGNWLLGALGRKAGHHAAAADGRAFGTRDQGELLRGLAPLQARRHQLQKTCTPASRIIPTSPGDGRSRKNINGGLILPAWSSSTRPVPRPP